MVTFSLPSTVRALIFDMDGTLYRHDGYLKAQTDDQIRLLAQERGVDLAELQGVLDAWAADWARTHGGHRPSLGNTLLGALGIPITESVELRRRALRPEAYLSPDPRLAETLAALAPRVTWVLVTNNPADVARRTLAALGVEAWFPRIIGLDESGHSKPHPAAFELAYRALGVAPEASVSVGDRFAVDLEVPLGWGAGGVLVESMDDLYQLPSCLFGEKS